MAGCRPEYFPVVGAALRAIGDPAFMLHGPATSTGGAALMVIVNGPIRARLGLHGEANLFGPGFRANATIGRALRLVLLNCLECQPGVLDKSTQGWPGKYSLCFAEDEESSPWEPLSRGARVPPGRSTVTVFAAESGHNVLEPRHGDPERCSPVRRRHGRSRQPEPRPLGHRVRARARRPSRAGADGAAARTQAWLYEHAWRSLADLKRGGKVEPAFFTNPAAPRVALP